MLVNSAIPRTISTVNITSVTSACAELLNSFMYTVFDITAALNVTFNA